MAEYKIHTVQENPREWNGPNGTVYYISVGVEGHDKLISVGKKSPDALKVGDTITGTIEPTEYPTDKFKEERSFPQKYDGPKKGYTQRDDNAIRAQWAIGQAVQLHIAVTAKGGEEAQSIYDTAVELYAMVDRVKDSNTEEKQADLLGKL